MFLKAEKPAMGLLDELPACIMLCDVTNFVIIYMNRSSRRMLERMADSLPIPPDAVLGSSIDIFHRQPEHQRRLLSDPSRLPHRARIALGDELLDLTITACRDQAGRYVLAALTWSVVTESMRIERQGARLARMIDQMPINVMTCDIADDFRIDYMNRTSIETLRGLREHLPVPVEQILGSSFDIFHRSPDRQRRLLSDPTNLPILARIKLGPHTLKLQVSAIADEDGGYVMPMLNWSVVTADVTMADAVSQVVQDLSASAAQLEMTAQSLTASTVQAGQQGSAVAATSEGLGRSVEEVALRVADVSLQARDAVAEAGRTSVLVSGLSDSAAEIGEIVELISRIARQTNLLALNATIEASRAGDAGKGFAVVAGEVKALADQTAQATRDIARQVAAIQSATHQTVGAIDLIVGHIGRTSGVMDSIASSIASQSSAAKEVSHNIAGVAEASDRTRAEAGAVLDAASRLSGTAARLRDEIRRFLDGSR